MKMDLKKTLKKYVLHLLIWIYYVKSELHMGNTKMLF